MPLLHGGNAHEHDYRHKTPPQAQHDLGSHARSPENFGYMFVDSNGRRGTFYLDVTPQQLHGWTAG